MPRKQQTEAEKAQTPLQEELARFPHSVEVIDAVVFQIKLQHQLSRYDALAALRDYFQWLLAAEVDKSLAETQERLEEMKRKLGETA
jgi:hypothetical protein